MIKNYTDFKAQVINFIKMVPKGKVVSYGQVAAACGKPKGAREVGRILRNLDISVHTIRGPQISNGNLGKGIKFRRPKRAKNFLRGKAAETIVPWWRVINNAGQISIKGNWTADKELQGLLLRKDGVKVSKELRIDMEKYRFIL
jgi:methylated-DNA-protein-cysteine methyltransferase-like protein